MKQVFEGTFTERLKRIIQESGLSLPKFAEQTEVSKNTLVNYRDGVTQPTADFLEHVCRRFDVSARWLLLGEGDPRATPHTGGGPSGEEFVSDAYCMVPLLKSRVTGGPEGELLYGEIEDYYPFKRWWLEKMVGKNPDRVRSIVLIRVRGDSMSPTINQGEMALVDTGEGERIQVLTGRIYLVILPDGTVALKRLVLSREEDRTRLVCLSDNTADYRPFEFVLDPEKTLRNYVLGRVRWAGKEFE